MPILLNSGNVAGDPTLGDLVEETISSLSAWVRNQEQVTWITEVLTDDGLTISLDDAEQVSRGTCELGYEQIYVSSVNLNGNTATIAAFGRGYNNTFPEQHEINTKLVNSPLFPRIRVAEAINQVVAGLQGKIPVVAQTTFLYSTSVQTYTLPSDCVEVLGVEQVSFGSSQTWQPVLDWRHDAHNAAGSDVGTNSLTLLKTLSVDRTVRVTYATYPQLFDSTDDEFSVTGLDTNCRDILVLGAASRMIAYIDAGRLDVSAAAADIQDSNVSIGSATALSRYLYQLYATRVEEERARILNRHNQYISFPGA